MNTASKAILSFFAACCLFVTACALHVVPSARIWDGYQVVFFPQDQDLSFLKESSVQNLFPGIISEITAVRGDSLVPPDFTGKEPVYRNFYLSSGHSFARGSWNADSIRSFFFRDMAGEFQLVYVPDSQFKPFCTLLNSRKMAYGTDSTVDMPYGGGIAVVLLALVVVLVARPPVLHCLMLVPVVAAPFLAPWYTVLAACCAVLGLFPFIERYWKRIRGISLFIKNPVCIVFTAVAVVLLVLTPPEPLVVLLLCLASAACSGAALHLQERWAASTRHFSFTPILSGTFVQVDLRRKILVVTGYGCAVLGLLLISLFSTVTGSLQGGDGLSLPGPTQYNESVASGDRWTATEELQNPERYPDIADFVAELWQRQAYPFRRISERNDMFPSRGSTVSVSHFYEDETGVHEIQKDVLVFDDQYLENSMNWLTDNDSVAAFLLTQDAAASTTYTTTGAFTVTAADYAGLAVSICAAAGLCLVILITRARQRSSEK